MNTEINSYFIIGVMSGTSLDGIDLAYVHFEKKTNYNFKVLASTTFAYSEFWKQELANAINYDDVELSKLNKAYTKYLADEISRFIQEFKIDELDAIASHGHTIKHEPDNNYTLQIGNLPEIAMYLNTKVVCDFRVQDVQLGGQGAPLVPIGDILLFNEYRYCLNLGGFANISDKSDKQIIAYDICAVNTVFNYYAQKLGKAYDDGGELAASGKLNEELLQKLNSLTFYRQKPPKSLGIEWVRAEVLPILEGAELSVADIMHTYAIHVAQQVANMLNFNKDKVLVTGGGAFNTYLIELFQKYSDCEFIIPKKEIIEYKEAIIFGLLGVLKLENKINVLKTVTGAKKDHSSGVTFNAVKND
ncbi:anhydro-N-acetylmuramic acid kinase [Zunongwangia sp.]|uniref:anhydro-N-acetylmuramic acid kinase n=1 Tax=Zunongwangia sp. TaxID=1965325 RepID=UPI003AA9D143